MRFIVDRCAGRRLAEWLANNGHDVLDSRTLGPDPGDMALLMLAESEDRILITLDKDFGELIYLRDIPHAGRIRRPDVLVSQRIALVEQTIKQHSQALEERAIITIQGAGARKVSGRSITRKRFTETGGANLAMTKL